MCEVEANQRLPVTTPDCFHASTFPPLDAPMTSVRAMAVARPSAIGPMRSCTRAATPGLPGAGHLLNIEQPDAFNTVLLQFLQQR